MNAQQLYLKDGKPAGVAYCGECNIVYRDAEFAETCCTPSSCRTCDGEIKHGALQCSACTDAAHAKRTQATYDNATKIPLSAAGDYVYVDDTYVCPDELEEWLDDKRAEYENAAWSPHIYATIEVQPVIDVESAIDNALDDAPEESHYAVHGISAIASLEKLALDWSKAHLPKHYEADMTRAIILVAPEPAESEGSC